MSLHLSHCRETGLLLRQGISGSIPLEAENTESLSHTYFCGKAPLDVLVKSWLNSSVEDREAFSSRDDMRCTELSSTALLNLMILYTWDGCLRESLEFPKGSQATCSVSCGSRVGDGVNAREIGLISL